MIFGGSAAPAADTVPAIAAASDLKFALEEIAGQFKADTGRDVRLTFGSSGNLARQMEQGARSRCSCPPMKTWCLDSPTRG